MSNHQLNQPIQHAGINDHVQDHVSILIENMFRDMPATSLEHSIFRVLHQLRQVNEKAYEPVILAIGPYHHRNDKFKCMEVQKLRYLQKLLERRQEESVDRYIPALRELEQQARNCYAETIDLSQEKFLAMMLIDGCFIVELFREGGFARRQNYSRTSRPLHSLTSRPLHNPLGESEWFQGYLRRDLLLLENQLPFFVLCKLYDLTKVPDEHHEFNVVAMKYFKCEREDRNRDWTCVHWEHLLHLYHKCSTYGSLPEHSQTCMAVISSATELRESGVRFRAVQGRHLVDIKFENGTLEMPVLIVDDDTESKYRNLIAYEQHHLSRGINNFADYMTFMGCLINSSKDVKVLRRAGIIENYLGNDEVVAQMFNKMCDEIILSGSYYSRIFQKLNAHCKKRRNVWMATLRREYFHNPWAFLSVVAAIVLLLLTAAQTVYTVLSYTKST